MIPIKLFPDLYTCMLTYQGITLYIIYTFLCILHTAVSGQECTDTVGWFGHDGNVVPQGQSFILAGYTVPCSGTVVAWEFCYRIAKWCRISDILSWYLEDNRNEGYGKYQEFNIAASLYEICSLRWESSGKYSKRQNWVQYLSWDSCQEL